jgi:hypothetical protein
MNGTDNGLDTKALGDALAGLFAAPAQMAAALAGSLTGPVSRLGSSGCEIPPPCWEPRPAGTCTLVLPPGGAGTIRVHVANCDWSRGVVVLTSTGKIAGWMTFQPTTMVIDAQSHGTFRVTVRVPEGVEPGETLSGPLLVRGCLDHFVRVVVRVAECADGGCCDASVRDCHDQIHHWYDHFYCPRPCRKARQTKDPQDG